MLRSVEEADVAIFFEYQLDDGARAMISYDGEPPADRRSFEVKWEKIRTNEIGWARTVVTEDGAVAGFFVSFLRDGVREIGYFLGRPFWGRGLATAALREFLTIEKTRPLAARVSKHNVGSLRVVQKCGFVITGEDTWRPQIEGAPEIPEWVLRLE